MGSIVKGIGSLFGGRARRKEQRSAQKGFDSARENLENFEFEKDYEKLGNYIILIPTDMTKTY